MNIAIVYPPIKKQGKIPLLGQNRQFKYTNSNQIKIFPLVPASLATLLKNDGHNILWLDAINKQVPDFEKKLIDFKPDIIFLETKTPIIKRHWEWIANFKLKISNCKFILFGDHVSFFPEESLQNSEVDYVITGGDYDVIGLYLVRYLNGRAEIPKGVFYKWQMADGGWQIKNTGMPEFLQNLDLLPFIDRDMTDWKTYGEAYLYRPCVYILTGRGCGREGKETGGVCTFCIWQHAFWQRRARLRSALNVAEEIEMLIKKYNVYEIFDDNESGALWSFDWLADFLIEIEKRNLKGKFVISSNARAEDLTDEKCKIMKRIGYRLLKVGLESGNSEILKKIGKLETIEQIKENIKRAKDYGFKILMTMMVGYPWETEDDVKRTYETAKELMLYKTHFGDSLQASIVMPYPGTPMYKEAEKYGWLTDAAKDYENFDMEHDILKSNIDTTYWCRKIWNIHTYPLFLIKSALSIRSIRDIDIALRGIMSLLGHLKDY
ncbi:MAG: radical SAM protein [Candidatus Goldbacteria bacterium]|nr:radical SAM protein [Candidatus Goldiibacteriota bacterium]